MRNIILNRKCILKPVKNCTWASEMVLNPAIIEDRKTGRIHMLVRTSGPYPEKKQDGMPMPFPIFMAYAYSDDGGETFNFDFSRPAIAPTLEYDPDKIWCIDDRGEKVPAYYNGCLEDPRFFYIGDECFLTLACRMFPPGPYWEHDDPVQCMPSWALEDSSPFGTQKNPTVSLLYRVDLDALGRMDYDRAFRYVTNLTDPIYGEDRDVILFPKRMIIDGELQYVMIHRPVTPNKYDKFSVQRPSIVISAAKDFYSFAKCATRRELFYTPSLDWQGNRVGASAQLVDMGDGEWLMSFHGKKDDATGYTQSFMILKESENDFPVITHLCPERMITAEADFEQPRKFGIPCVFFTGMIKLADRLLISYGAADEFAAIMELDYNNLVNKVKEYPYGK